jgi:hypothetical protein
LAPDIPICRTVQKWTCYRVGRCSGLVRGSGFQISTASAQRQGDRLVGDPWLDPLRACVADKQRVSAKEPSDAVLELPYSRQSQLEAKRLSGLMVQLGFQHRKSLRFGQQVLTVALIMKALETKKKARTCFSGQFDKTLTTRRISREVGLEPTQVERSNTCLRSRTSASARF